MNLVVWEDAGKGGWLGGEVGIERNPDLEISGADRVGCLFSVLGPT